MRRLLIGLLFGLAFASPLTPAGAADPQPALRVAVAIAETSFDPAFASDAVSDLVIALVMESMLDYDYLARPVTLVPRTLEAMPAVADGGRTFTFKLKKGIFFAPDPAFGGRPRELVAADYAYALKRILDPGVKSPWLWMLEGKIVGADAVVEQTAKAGRFDYEARIAGLEVVDRYTLRIRLKEPDLRFLYVLAVPNTAAVAREVVEAYGNDLGAHPVGTGPYRLGEYKRSSKIELVANPGFRPVTYAPTGPVPPALQPVATALKGKRLPLTPRIEISVVEEAQGRWLGFVNGEMDIITTVPSTLSERAIVDGKLKPELAAKGIRHQALVRANTAYTYFNMEDPVVGGYTPEKIALRRAIGMGYDIKEVLRLVNGRAVPAKGPIPPDIAGYDPSLRTNAQAYDPAAARALLDKFGYKDRDGDGYRETPDGRPLVIERWSTPSSVAREGDELWKRNMDAIGVRMVFKKDKLPELRKMARQGKIAMRGDQWGADYPDAENFMQLLYGPNGAQENSARFNLPEFNRLFEEAQRLPDGPVRTKLFNRMTEIVLAYMPWRVTVHTIDDTLSHPWVHHYVGHPIRFPGFWQYVEIGAKAQVVAR
jgi:ABC-type transport system substrate-binding protein